MATQDELSANASPQKPGKPTGEPIDTYLMIGAIGAIAIAVIVPWLPLSNSQFETLGWIAGRGAIATFIITLFFAGFKKGSSSGGSFATIFFFAFLLTRITMIPGLNRIHATQTAVAFAATEAANLTAVPATQAAHLTAVSATQTAQPTFTQGPTSTATLLPKFAAATEDARIARDLASTETAFQAAQAATATYIGSFNLIDFRELRDYPANHIGEKVCLKGRVFNVNPPTEFQMYVGDTYDDAYIVTDTEFSKLYQDDPVFICGISADNKTFTNALGAQVSTPLIEHAFFR